MPFFIPRVAQSNALRTCLCALLSLALSGCGSVPVNVVPTQVQLPAFEGQVVGGETPIAGSQITLWETDPANSGYGIATSGTTGAQKLATAVGSTPGGNFTFTTGYTCSPGEFVYLTSTGGDVSNGSSIINKNAVLVAALGSCANFATAAQQAKVTILANEVSTVAAAYALDAFATVSGSPGNQQLYIGAPAANNATTGACIGSGTTFSCSAAGLAHAFANAANLTDSVHYDGSFPSGTALQTVPGNTHASVPQALINTLASIVQYCVNSSGTTSGAGDGTACGTLFSYATPPVGAAPTDTFSALMNIARAPYNNVGSGTCTGKGGLFCLVPATPAFVPTLASAPNDWSIAIAYSAPSSSTSFASPQYLNLDANDNVYVEAGNAYTPTSNSLMAMSAGGSFLWGNALSPNICASGNTASDANGNVWLTVNESSSLTGCAFGIYEYNATSGLQKSFFTAASGNVCNTSAPTSANCPGFTAYDTVHAIQSTVKTIAFDRFSNLWWGRSSATCIGCVFELPYSAGSYLAPTTQEQSIPYSNQMLIDANDNIWIANATSPALPTVTDGKLFLIYNTGTAAAPAYTASSGFVSTTLPSYNDGGIGIDSAGNVWGASNDNLNEYTPTVKGATSSFNTAVHDTATTASLPTTSEVDGTGTFWYGSLDALGQIWLHYTPTAPYYSQTGINDHYLRPCYVPAGGNTCDTALGSSTYASGYPKALQIDSAGSMWVAAGSSSASSTGFVLQVLGAANPTWPLYQLGVFGKEPQ